jgi:imidazolonepropionase-like amidohydrolase
MALLLAAAIIVLRGGVLLDGTGDPPIGDAVVVVRGDRIAAVGPAARTPVSEGATIVDVRGKWIVPGLIDSHVHVGHVDVGRDPTRSVEALNDVVLVMRGGVIVRREE